MYNEDQKKEYLSYIGDDDFAITIQNYFKRIAEMEEYLGKDIADMNVNEAISALLTLNIRSVNYRSHVISCLRGYAEWVISTGRGTQDNQLNSIRVEHLSSEKAIRMQMLKDPNQLNEILRKVFPMDYNFPRRAERDSLILNLLYLGMTPEELQLLKKKDIQVEEMIIKSPLSDTVYTIDERIISLWEKCSESSVIEKSGARQGKDFFVCKLFDSDFLFRSMQGFSNKEMFRIQNFARTVNKIFRDYSKISDEVIYISIIGVRRSGLFYRIYLSEQGGLKITPKVISEIIDDKKIKPTSLNSRGRILYKDYIEWKTAFEL
jgi:integrase